MIRGIVLPSDGHVAKMNRTIKDARVTRYQYDGQDPLRTHLADVMAAFNCARRLKTRGGPTPSACVCKVWTSSRVA